MYLLLVGTQEQGSYPYKLVRCITKLRTPE